ncbi:hypothetical protein ACFX1Q_013893 [Malus domestica]
MPSRTGLASESMTIETRSIKKKAIMGKSTTDLPVRSPRQNLSHAQNPLITVIPEATSVTHRENKVCRGTQPRNIEIPNKTAGVFIEGIMEDCNENGGEGSDPQLGRFFEDDLTSNLGRLNRQLAKN